MTLRKYCPKVLGEELKTITFEKQETTFPISLTDSSYYVPNSEVNKTIDAKKTMSHDPNLYDYPNGDTSTNTVRIAETRKPGLDIVEVADNVKEISKNAKEALNNDAKDKVNAELADKAGKRNMVAEIVKQNATTTQKTSE